MDKAQERATDMAFWNHEIETMPLESLQTLQCNRLRSMVEYAGNCVPFYRDLFSEARVDPSKILTLADLKTLPFTTKEDLRSHPLAFRATASPIARIHCSGGTTGKPKITCFTQHDWDEAVDVTARSLVTTGVTRSDVVAVVQPFGIWAIGSEFTDALSKIGALAIPLGLSLDDSDAVRLMQLFDTTVILGAPSNLCRVSAFVVEQGLNPGLDFNVRKLLVCGEKLTTNQRQYLNELWNAETFDLYGSAETDTIGVECSARNGVHVWLDQFIVEILNPETHRPVEVGREGELVITTLTKQGTPLIRYRLGDIARVSDSKCSCQRSHPLLAVTGRVKEAVCLKEGTKVYAYQVEEALKQVSDQALNYQVVVDEVEGRDRLSFLIETGASEEDGPKEGFEKALARLSIDFVDAMNANIVLPPRVRIVDPAEFEVTTRGKLRRFVDKRDRSFDMH
jgi:phenylacetate-CoA ligase